ncbi:SUMO-interacting motif-containing protein 1 isoform X3 [Xiphias gladius]|uniref:SUMO-interacting motif-containing protein 1 isoform X3 n=1 Tax=Xiphias gladius TaxID=8245 RepID=UPI001A9937A4|nr:SUMO-interacting motif-containing protein 1 isoform X3 [Xiphias gladius]
MDDAIILSSDDSDVEIVGSFTTKAEPLPLTSVRVEVDALSVNVPPHYIDLTDPRWTVPELKMRKRQNSTALAVVDLTESDSANGTEQEIKNMLPGDCQIKNESSNKNQTSKKQDINLQKSSSSDSAFLAPQQDCGNLKPKMRCLNSQTQHQKHSYKGHPCHHTPAVKLRRLPFLETHVRELKTSRFSVHLTRDCTQMSLCFRQLDNSDAPECIGNLTTTSASNGPCMEPSLDESPPKVAESLIGQEQQENSNEFTITRLYDFSDHSSPHSPTTRLNPSELFNLDSLPHRSPVSHDLKSQVDPTPTSDHTPVENRSEWQSDEAKTERASNSPNFLCLSIPSESPLSVSKTEDMDERSGTGTYRGDLGIDSPLSFVWQEGSDGEEVNEESRFDMDFRAASQEDRHFVCPVTLRKIMSGPGQALIDVEDEGFGTPEVLCRQSLSLVYSTIDENYPEGTLQLLSDLLQPGYYPPRDITMHLLRSILLDPQCPHHLGVQAFNLLMRTQRHHMADKTTVPWDWELLTSVVASQDSTKRHRCEVVRMLLEYVVQTLEDDFQAKRSISALHHSIAKGTLSCDQQFPRVRDVIKWLFSAIMKSTENEESRERDEQIRMVSIFQRMLSLALEVDRSPALNSAKLSQELFHMLISNMPLRAHSLLLHFLKNCTLAPDPTDGTGRWQRWEELVHLLWMLLLSYNKAMKGYLCNSVTEQRGRVSTLVYKPDDKVSKLAIREAVETFLFRSQADLGQALPLHVEESLTYLQDHLLDVCQC